MPNYPVTASAKDETVGAGATTTGVDMTVSYSTTLGGTSSTGVANLDTSAIGTDTITAATLYWYHSAYTKSKLGTYNRLITVGGHGVLNSTATPPAAGWHSVALDATAQGYINKTGDTQVIFDVGNANPYDRQWTIRAWDYGGAGAYACYLAVTHAAAGGPTKFSILR